MPTSYVECPDCGKRALSVATRCPHCGHHFPPRPLVRPSQEPRLGASRGMAAVGGAVLALVIVALLVRRGPAGPERTAAAPSGSAGATAASAPAPAPPAAVDTAKATGSTSRPAPVAAAAGPAPTATEAVSSPAPAPGPGPSPIRDGLRRYAQTWANVRGERTRSAPAVGRLNPGDAVTVDSLVRGWYRVLVDGRTLGYVHRSSLDVNRPE